MTVLRYSLLIAAALLAVTGAALKAQPSKGPPNALQGFSQNRDQPVHIEAATLEVRDKDKMATFSGDVRVSARRHQYALQNTKGVLRTRRCK